MRRCCLPLALWLLVGCGAAPQRETISYRFRQSMLDDGDHPVGFAPRTRKHRRRVKQKRRAAKKQTVPRRLAADPRGNDVTRRCRKLRGRTFAGPRHRATLQLLEACLGRSLPAELMQGQGIELRRDPVPGDVVLFHNTRDRNRNRRVDDHYTDAGVVINVRGPRVRFVYLHPRSGRAHIGTLNLRQPNRRRLGSPTIQNTFLRIKRPTDPPETRYLAGQLLAGFASPPSAPTAALGPGGREDAL